MNFAWCGGFYSGEGSVWYCKRVQKSGYTSQGLRLQIDQCEKQPLLLFRKEIGGLGKLNGPYAPHNLGKRPVYKYSINGKEGVLALKRMWPYLTQPKKEQARLVLAKYTAHNRKGDQ